MTAQKFNITGPVYLSDKDGTVKVPEAELQKRKLSASEITPSLECLADNSALVRLKVMECDD